MEQLLLWDIEEKFKYLKPEKFIDWKWTMANDYPTKNGLKVFSCFACGGGSTMGYKLVGCDVIGCCEIDKHCIKLTSYRDPDIIHCGDAFQVRNADWGLK